MVRARGVGSFAHVGRDVSKASWSHDWYSLACKHLELEFAKGGGDREFEWNAHNAAPRRDRCGGNCADTTPTSGQLGLIALKL